MSEHVTTQAAAPAVSPAQLTNGVVLQRKCACGSYGEGGECDKCRKGNGLQRKARGSAVPPALPAEVDHVLGSSGQSLDPAIRRWMEPRLGHDFSSVRVHTDAAAAESARKVNALAYTVGEDVVFATGQYSPNTKAGGTLLAHELTHVVQQAKTPASRAQHSKAISDASDAAEIEADNAAPRLLQGEEVEVNESPNATLHALTPGETTGVVIGSIVGSAGIAAGIAWLAGAFDKESFSDTELLEYVTALAKDRKIQKGSTSDNKARDLVGKWKVNETLDLDKEFKAKEGSLTIVELKRLLILEMLDGPTGESDERSIITIFKKSSESEIKELLTPTLGLSLQDIESDLSEENLKELMAVLNEKLPTIGEPHVKRSETPGKKSGACTVGRAIKIEFAQKQAESIVARTVQVLDSFISNPAGNKTIQDQLNCYFNGPTQNEVKRVRDDFQQISTTLPLLTYICPAEPFEEFKAGGRVFKQEKDLEARSLVVKEEAKPGAPASPTPTPEAPGLPVIIFPEFFDAPPRHQARVFIHEAFHHAKKQGDEVPEESKHYNPSCGVLSKDEAFINADTYATFAMKLTPEGVLSKLDGQNQKGVQRKAAEPAPSAVPSIVQDVVAASGEPLAEPTRAFMEPHFGHDFSDVRVHTGSIAAESARALNATAYTVGEDIVFNSEQYEPTTARGN
ncbi:MAG TPA: DUF4157 domain-containing protein, partial [Pyrinomonadaceae bacterium]|nr:DUF4157 domain-containing protein [Pyrinomonadaceae bacterium]